MSRTLNSCSVYSLAYGIHGPLSVAALHFYRESNTGKADIALSLLGFPGDDCSFKRGLQPTGEEWVEDTHRKGRANCLLSLNLY